VGSEIHKTHEPYLWNPRRKIQSRLGYTLADTRKGDYREVLGGAQPLHIEIGVHHRDRLIIVGFNGDPFLRRGKLGKANKSI
jgi:hypothetical protein